MKDCHDCRCPLDPEVQICEETKHAPPKINIELENDG